MATESDVQSEIEVLQSIYLDELQVNRGEDMSWQVSLVLHPCTAEDSVSQFVRLTLMLTLDHQYPSSPPVISIHNSRGLSDDKLCSVQRCLQLEAESWIGSPVLYQLIEKAKEFLTESNIPHGNCVICLYDFKEGETFTKTSCYHYFHSHCLGRYISHSERELRQREKELEEDKTRDRTDAQELAVMCPVCREPLVYDMDQLLSSPAPRLPELDEAAISLDFQKKWCELQKLWEKQKTKGGIIDPEAESNRFLIHINQTQSETENGVVEENLSPGPPASASSTDSTLQAQHFIPELSHFPDVEGPRHPNHVRGPRRGGRSRAHPGRAAAIITQHLEELCVSSERAEQSSASNPKSHQRRTAGEGGRRASPSHQPKLQPALEPQVPADGANHRGHRGRRRGPHRPGPPQHHWDGRTARGRGAATDLWASGGAPRRGHHRRDPQKVGDRGREAV